MKDNERSRGKETHLEDKKDIIEYYVKKRYGCGIR
jgi:hypothetical protein